MTPGISSVENSRGGSHVVHYERLRLGRFFADFRRDTRLHPEIYHCIVQREGSTQILIWSQFRSLEEARQAAERELKRLGAAETPSTEPQE